MFSPVSTMVSFTSTFKTLLVVLPLALSAMGASPTTGNYQIFNPSSNLYLDVRGSSNATQTPIISFTHNTPISVNQKWRVDQATFGPTNVDVVSSLIPSTAGLRISVGLIPAAGAGAVTNVIPTPLNITEVSPGEFTIGVTNTNLALQGGNGSGQQVTAQILNPTNVLQIWVFTPV